MNLTNSHAPETPIGLGVYSYLDAARFIGSSASELRRWMIGTKSPPLWDAELTPYGIDGVGFRDLLELRFVKEFRKAGISLQAIREAVRFARQELDADRPFQCQRFQHDGRRIFATILERTGDESLVDVVKRQRTFKEIVGPSLYEGIEFDKKRALCWFPTKSRKIVLDPNRRFGHPIIERTGVPTIALAESLAVEGSAALVARLYGVKIGDVRQAAEFESSLRH